MEDFIGLLAIVAVSFWAGWAFREYQARVRVDRLLDMMEEEGINLEPPTARKIRIEVVKDVFYIYDLETNEFLAQGENRMILEKNLADRFPDTFFAATQENLKEVGFE